MKSISLKLDFKSLAGKFKSSPAWLFYVILLAMVVMELFILFAAGKQIVVSRQSSENFLPPKGVRFNFTEYDQAAKRIQAGKDFYPGTPLYKNPFGAK